MFRLLGGSVRRRDLRRADVEDLGYLLGVRAGQAVHLSEGGDDGNGLAAESTIGVVAGVSGAGGEPGREGVGLVVHGAIVVWVDPEAKELWREAHVHEATALWCAAAKRPIRLVTAS